MLASLLERFSGPSHLARSLLLILICLCAFSPGIAALPPIDRDEARFIQATKQMAETHDYVDIRFQEVARYKKPVGIYWLQAASLALTGADPQKDMWSYRLVSVAGATIAVLIVAFLGALMFNGQTGLVAGMLTAGMFMLCFESRIAKTDAVLLATCLAAQASLARIYLSARQNVPAGKTWLVFWLALGAGILIKGPIAPLLALVTALALCLADRNISWMRGLKPVPGFILMVLVAAPWLVLITLKSGGAFWTESIGRDLLGKVADGQESHGAPSGYYALIFPLFMWPLPVIAIQGGLAALTRFRSDPRLRFLLAWYLPWWLLVELMPTKLPHYILPAYPALILLGAAFLTGQLEPSENPPRWHGWLVNISRFGLAVATSALVILAIALPVYASQRISAPGVLVSAIVIITALVGMNTRKFEHWPDLAKAGSLVLGSALMWALMVGSVLPSARLIWPSAQIAQTYLLSLGACRAPRLVSVGFHEPSLVVLAGTNTLLTGSRGAAEALRADPECTMVSLATSEKADLIAALGADAVRLTKIETIEAVNYSKGKALTIELMQLTPP